MADDFIENSRRRLSKITFTPLVLPEGRDGGGALQLAAAADQMGLLPGEAAIARRAAGNDRNVNAALDAFEQLAVAATPDERLAASAALAGLSRDALTGAVTLIRAAREQALNQAVSAVQSLTRRFIALPPPAAPAPAGAGSGAGTGAGTGAGAGGAGAANPTFAGTSVFSSGRPLTLDQLSSAISSGVSSGLAGTSISGAAGAAVAPPSSPLPGPDLAPALAARLGGNLAPKALEAMRWGEKNDPGLITELLNGVATFVPEPMRTNGSQLLLTGLPFLIAQVQKTADVKSHLTQRNLQPVGLLHLEQLIMTPVAIERGELLYTLPLAPHEKVTLSHKEWTLREEEYSRFVQDYLENYSERGVAQKTDIGVSSRSETEHSKTLSMGKPMVPGAATIADPVDTQTSTEEVTSEKQSEEKSRRETQEITQKASSLSVRDQKVSFTVSTVSGTEDFTARLYENPTDDKVMLVDYFRRMRKWRNDLYRTGIRMTYDVVLPDPGRLLRDRWLQVKALDDQLAAPFVFEYTPSAPRGPSQNFLVAGASSAGFGAAVTSSISGFEFETASVADLGQLARSYGATLPPAPNQVQSVEQTRAVVEPAVRNDAYTFAVTVNIPPNYKVTKAWIGGETTPSGDADVWIAGEFWSQRLDLPADGVFYSRPINTTGKPPNTITGMFTAHKGAVGNVRVWADIEPTDDAWRVWRDSAWTIIRQAAWTRYNENRDRLLQRRAALLNELQAPDTLTLRRMEREQIMYLVLRWLFPDFDAAGQIYRDAAQQKGSSWQPALEYGEYIKFVHQAIDWDNALVVLYPYFWDNPDNHAVKLYLNHPDGGHQEFLRAGAARVILAIRAGYEEEVVSLLDKGRLGKLTEDSRFLPIIEKVQKANERLSKLIDSAEDVVTNGNGDGDDDDDDADNPAQPRLGERIGRWEDWTPTSALDMDVRFRGVIQET